MLAREAGGGGDAFGVDEGEGPRFVLQSARQKGLGVVELTECGCSVYGGYSS